MINHKFHISITMLAAFLFGSGALGQRTTDTVQVYSAGQVITKAFLKTNDGWAAHPCTIGKNIFIVSTEEVSTLKFDTLIKSQFIVEVDGVPRPLYLEKEQLAALSPFSDNSFRELLKASSTLQRSVDAIEGELLTQEYIVQSPRSVTIPQIIVLHRDHNYEKAWVSIQLAKKISVDRMKRGEPGYPHPYFAEALLWTKLGRHEEALVNFSMGSHIAIKNGQNLNDQVEYYREFNSYLRAYLQSPLPQSDPTTEKDAVLVARRYFARGVSSYKKGDHSKAIEYFTEAILLNPNRASYWHYRALCFRANNFTQRATHDITMGIAIERKYHQSSIVYAALTSAQGADRLWLEAYRNRQNIPILVKANDPNTTR
jgi:tetratricopeptide (TPR) repeat protein